VSQGEKACFFVAGHSHGDDGGASVGGGPGDEVVGVVEAEWVVSFVDAPVENEFESVAGLESERDSVIAVVPETGRVPFDPLAKFSIASKETGSESSDVVNPQVIEFGEELVDGWLLGAHSFSLIRIGTNASMSRSMSS
jgi:hypothetical protein